MYLGVLPRRFLIVFSIGGGGVGVSLDHSSIITSLDRMRSHVIVHLVPSQGASLCPWLVIVSACSLPKIPR